MAIENLSRPSGLTSLIIQLLVYSFHLYKLRHMLSAQKGFLCTLPRATTQPCLSHASSEANWCTKQIEPFIGLIYDQYYAILV